MEEYLKLELVSPFVSQICFDFIDGAVPATRLRPNSPGPLTDNWKFTDESSITFQSSVSGPGEFSHSVRSYIQPQAASWDSTIYEIKINAA